MRKIKSFKCNTCDHTYDAYVEDGHRAPCTKCNSRDIVFVITAPAIKVNGQGAYTNKMKVS